MSGEYKTFLIPLSVLASQSHSTIVQAQIFAFQKKCIKLMLVDFFKDLFIFRKRVKEGERQGEKHQCVVAFFEGALLGTWPATQACALTGN